MWKRRDIEYNPTLIHGVGHRPGCAGIKRLTTFIFQKWKLLPGFIFMIFKIGNMMTVAATAVVEGT